MALLGLDNHTAQPRRRVQEAADPHAPRTCYCRLCFCNALDQIRPEACVFDIESGKRIPHKLHRRTPACECLDSCGYPGRRALGAAAIVVRLFSASSPSFPIPIRTCPLCVLHSHAGRTIVFRNRMLGA